MGLCSLLCPPGASFNYAQSSVTLILTLNHYLHGPWCQTQESTPAEHRGSTPAEQHRGAHLQKSTAEHPLLNNHLGFAWKFWNLFVVCNLAYESYWLALTHASIWYSLLFLKYTYFLTDRSSDTSSYTDTMWEPQHWPQEKGFSM